MSEFLVELRSTLLPGVGDKDGPLPPLLIAMTVVTGLIDAFSYLALHHVFVANMTGNVVFFGFALAGAPGFSLSAPVVALAAFVTGALGTGRIMSLRPAHRGRLLSEVTGVQTLLFGAGAVIAGLSGIHRSQAVTDVLIFLLALAMGAQNAVVRRIGVADLPTTVLTMAITGLSADSSAGSGRGARAGRRLCSVVALALGAFVGALLVIHRNETPVLVIPAVIVFAVGIGARRLRRDDDAWTKLEN